MEVWRQLYDFPGYSVSNMGRVRNDDNGRIMTMLRNQYGVINVGLMLHGKQYKRSLPLLVANAFLPTWESDAFDTPINLNGDRLDCRAENLMWRPRWFAMKYHRQFRVGRISVPRRIVDEKTGEQFRNSMAAASTFGLLDDDIGWAIRHDTTVWPTYQTFHLTGRRTLKSRH